MDTGTLRSVPELKRLERLLAFVLPESDIFGLLNRMGYSETQLVILSAGEVAEICTEIVSIVRRHSETDGQTESWTVTEHRLG